MKLTFREYKMEDKNQLIELAKKLGQYSKTIDPIGRVQNLPGYFEAKIEDLLSDVTKHHGKIWFAQDGDKVMGYVIGAIWDQNTKNKLEIGPHKLGEVLDLYIEEDYRHKGIGTAMLAMMEKYFKEMGCDSVWISVFSPNTSALSCYKKFGFIEREVGMLKTI